MFFAPLALVAAVGLALLTSGEAAAMAIPAGSEVPAECFSVEKRIETGQRNPDAVSGNYWERHDRFFFEANFDAGCDIDAYVSGISIVIKTPYQIDSTPDIDDLDDADDFSVLEGQMQSDFPEFIQTFGGGAMTDSTGTALPAVGPSGAFTGARVCINSSIAACTPANAIPLMDIGGGLMIFTVDLGEGEIYLCDNEFGSDCEGSNSFDLVTIAHSNQFTPASPGDATVPEMVLGWRMVELQYESVPEPSLAALLLPVLAAGALRRRRH